MKKERLYLDSSVIGGYHDPEFADDSKRVIEYARQGRIITLMSEVVIQEISKAPQKVQDVLFSIPSSNIERVEMTEEIIALSNEYLSANILSQKWNDDTTHVAAATVSRANAIVSWNFRHIVRLDKMQAYNRVNLAHGYDILTIVTPKEIVYDEPTE
ncbi:MAG: hypothetical protein HY960_11205 [Ignavibacteriae bacterium]|nr:hypothetical protein [Ignavibacteriota bacterium]